jgi:Uma2 family endonuclease
MYQYELPRYLYLPTADELPCSDDTPVDKELQEIIPSLLKSILRILWHDRLDWFFGIELADRLIEQERQRADRLAAQLRALGIEPN